MVASEDRPPNLWGSSQLLPLGGGDISAPKEALGAVFAMHVRRSVPCASSSFSRGLQCSTFVLQVALMGQKAGS